MGVRSITGQGAGDSGRARALHVMNNRNIATRRSRLLKLSATRQGTRASPLGWRVHRRNLWNRPAALEADD
jgi:hypothetical protein